MFSATAEYYDKIYAFKDYRTEVDTLLGDSGRERERLGWEPEIPLQQLVAEMVREDLKIAERDELCKREGFQVFSYHE